MEAPTLRLEIVKGPRAGEALEFKPGKKVGIGRLMRGNAIQIKDDGISSKHLCIEFAADKWLITDLQSSNGTILNGAELDPLLPTLLRDGDVVKIGESTSITVRVRVWVESEDVANVRRNPRRRAAAGKNAVVECVGLKRARVTEGHDLDEKNKLEGGNDEEESPVHDKGRKVASKKKNVNKAVDENRPPVQVAEASNVKLENQVQEVVTGRTRGRPKKMNAVEEVSEAADEGLEAGNQAMKKSRGVRKGRALNEKTGEDELSVPVVEVSNRVADVSRDERGGLKSSRAMIKKTMEDEAIVVNEKCDMPLQMVPSEDGIKKQTCRRTGRGRRRGRGRVVEDGVVKETHEDIEIVNSESETQGQLVSIKTEKVFMSPSIVNETLCINSSGVVFENAKNLDGQVPVAVENGVSGMGNHETLMVSHETLEAGETLISEKMENVNRLGSLEPLEAASGHFAADQITVPSASYEKDIEDSEKEIHENLQNVKKEKLSICPSIHEKVSETFCINSSGSEFGNKRNSECDELEATDAGIEEKAGDMAGLELQEPLEVADILSGIAADAERIDSGRNASHGCPAEPGRHGSCSGKGSEVKLDEMTLGQWFDYLEVYLPRQIHNATEDMIAGMIEKSKRFQEYVSQQQIGKGKVPASSKT